MQISLTARAKVTLRHERLENGVWTLVNPEETVYNTITNAGRIRLHTFCYGNVARPNGLNYIAISSDGNAPLPGDVVLAGELTGNGLDRVLGAITLPTGSGNQTTIFYRFIYTGLAAQLVQKAALFDTAGPPPNGVMAHEIQFSPRSLFESDAISVTFNIILG